MRIRKTSTPSALPLDTAQVVDSYSTSTTDAYSANYVNGLNTYSTAEKRIGTFIDGKPIYKKSFYVSSYPNNTTTSFNHNLTFNNIIKIEGYGTNNTDLWIDTTSGSASGRMTITANTSNIFLYANTDRSSLSGYVTLYYTKTTD